MNPSCKEKVLVSWWLMKSKSTKLLLYQSLVASFPSSCTWVSVIISYDRSSCVWSHCVYIFSCSVSFYWVWPYSIITLFQNGKPDECKQDIWKWNCPNERSANPTEQWWRLLRSVVKQTVTKTLCYFLTMCCENQWLSKTVTLKT